MIVCINVLQNMSVLQQAGALKIKFANHAMETLPDTFDRWMVKQTEEKDALFLNQ
jgi:hypothetical protein